MLPKLHLAKKRYLWNSLTSWKHSIICKNGLQIHFQTLWIFISNNTISDQINLSGLIFSIAMMNLDFIFQIRETNSNYYSQSRSRSVAPTSLEENNLVNYYAGYVGRSKYSQQRELSSTPEFDTSNNKVFTVPTLKNILVCCLDCQVQYFVSELLFYLFLNTGKERKS